MSTIHVGDKPKHPEGVKLSDALRDDKERIKARKGLIDKTATLVKAPDEESDAFADLGGTMRPTDEQLEAINGFTRKTVTADEVVAFTTLSCNDIVDRDDDQFTTECVKDFAALEQPFSPVGKSFMLDHAYSTANAVGRIFDVDTKDVSGAKFLTNGVYMPKTPQFQPLIEKIDFGINWAVSVGVMLGKDECSLSWCKAPFSSWGWWCQNGHDKGLCYVEDGEEDAWGYPAPVDPKTKGAEKCVRLFSEPRDMYELSQVFLGAQYFAALEKQPSFSSVIKAAAKKELPIIGLSAEEAKELPIRHEPRKVSEARRTFGVTEEEDGSITWTDSEGLRWTFDPATPSEGVMSLGKAATNNDESEEDEDGEHTIRSGEGGAGEGEPDVGLDQPVAEPGDGGSGSEGDPPAAPGDEPSSQSGAGEPGSALGADDDEESEEDPDDTDEGDDPEDGSDEDLSEEEKAIRAAAVEAKLPRKVVEAGKGLDTLLTAAASEIEGLNKQIETLTPKAALGDTYIKSLRADAIDWYTKARATKDDPKVSTETYERLLDKCGDDVELLKAMAEEQKELAQAKFPKSVRRSSFPTDPNAAEKLTAVDFGDNDEIKEGGDDNDQRVKRIHG